MCQLHFNYSYKFTFFTIYVYIYYMFIIYSSYVSKTLIYKIHQHVQYYILYLNICAICTYRLFNYN